MKLSETTRLARALPLLVFFCAVAPVNVAQGAGRNSPDVPLHHWSYDAVQRLAAARLIDLSLLSTKPYSRRDFARMTAQAMERARRRNFGTLRETAALQEALYRLMDEYRPELLAMGVEMLRGDEEKIPRFQHRWSDPTRVDIVGVSAGGHVAGGTGARTRRALFDPDHLLMENQNGWVLGDGANVRTESRAWACAEPLGAISVGVASLLNPDSQRFQLQEAVARTSLWNLQLTAGRQSLWWGPGYHGALLLSNNARPLDMVRVSNCDPFHFPGIFRKLGPMRLNFFLASLGSNRNDFNNPYLNGMRLEWSPAPWLSLGVTRTIMLGGDGRNPTLGQYFRNILLAMGENVDAVSRYNPTDNDQKAGVDFRIRLPDMSGFIKVCREIELYGEIAGEDEAKFFSIPVPSNLAFLLGAYVPDIFAVNGLDLRFEWASNRVPGKPDVWYRHHVYTDGYTVDGQIIGHHMGAQADDYFLRLSKRFEDESELAVHFDLERHGVGAPNVETKYEGQLDFSYPVSETTRMGVFYRVQHFTNARNATGESRTNHIFGLTVRKTF